MLELFTATWCAFCPYADAAADRVLRVVGPERVSIIQYHIQTDPLKIDESDERRAIYGDPPLPSLFVDGELGSNTALSYEEALADYLSLVQERLEVSTPVGLDLDSEISGGSVALNTTVTGTESLAGQNLFLRIALFENLVEAEGKIYNYTVRAFNETSIDPVSMPYIESFTFTLNASWISDNMGAAVFLQTDSVGQIHQSVNAMFGDPPVITIADTSGGTVSGNHTIEGTCTGSRELSEVFVRIDDGMWVEAEGTSSWNYTLDTKKLSEGSHTIQARVYDVAGTYSQPDTISVTVKNEESIPSIELVLTLTAILLVAILSSPAGRRRR